MGRLSITISNQWAATFSQPVSFQLMPPALQSVVVPLDSGSSVGGGSGTPTAGHWLFCLVAMNEPSTAAGFTVGVGDDIHSFWRPGNESTSTWAVSTGSALTRTAIWYTANTSAVAGNVYVAPNGCFDALAVLVVEVAGLGPWDTVTGINTNYAAAATTLSLALSAPSGPAFLIGAVGGDDNANGPSFAPASWTALHTVSATNGTDHTSDAQLASAWIATSGGVSVNGTATSDTDLSGAVIGVLQTGTSPIPAANNLNWPYLKYEMALGGGFQTPPDQLTWTDLSSRLWDWDETTGIQYQLGNIQATNLTLELDNIDNYLASDNASSPYYPHLVTGTPMRIRAALGTIGGVTVNRWYVIQRNIQEWPQQVDPAYRRMITGTGTDIWSAMSSAPPTPYRGEVIQDKPYAWWPMDDQPATAGVLPTSLQNAAVGNSNVLNIVASPTGIGLTTVYFTNGTSSGSFLPGSPQGTSMALYEVAANSGWMYGDPPTAASTLPTGNPVSAQPGSASWQQVNLYGNTGSDGWFLSCNDASFPVLASGVTVEGWFLYPFYGSPTGEYQNGPPLGFPASTSVTSWTLFELATASHPVAVLQLNTSGHLVLITYNGATPTTNSVYTSTDLRQNAWFHVAVTLTTTTWEVFINGGATAAVSGSASGMTSAWTWLIVNGDLAANGGSSAGTGLVHGADVAISHLAVYPAVLPAWRILAHYVAACTGFGLLPTPTAVAMTLDGEDTSDGQYFSGIGITGGLSPTGQYGAYVSGPFGVTFEMSALVCATAPGSVTSAPSAWVAQAQTGPNSPSSTYYAVFVSWIGVAPSFAVYNGTQIDSDNQADLTIANSSLMTNHYGSSTVSQGIGHTGTGSGASPPASASAFGDTAAQRIERILGYSQAAYPGRCIDPAALLVSAATDIGGQQAGQNIQNITKSDGGLFFIDNLGNVTYWQKSHLAAQYSSPVWTFTPQAPPTAGAPSTAIPYWREGFTWTADPQYVWNAIALAPYSPDGSVLASITPADAAAAETSQQQYGAQPYQQSSYLQDTSEMQSFADWLLTNYGQVQIHVEGLKVDAAPYPAAWPVVLGVNVGDVVTCANWQIGGGGASGTFRVTSLKRRIVFGDDREPTEASVTLTLSYEPASYWS